MSFLFKRRLIIINIYKPEFFIIMHIIWISFYIFYRYCFKALPEVRLTKQRACALSQNCQMSTWSHLRPFNDSCKKPDGTVKPGFMKRSREIRHLAVGDGFACSEKMLELVQIHVGFSNDMRNCTR